MTRPPAFHIWKFLMKNITSPNSGLRLVSCPDRFLKKNCVGTGNSTQKKVVWARDYLSDVEEHLNPSSRQPQCFSSLSKDWPATCQRCEFLDEECLYRTIEAYRSSPIPYLGLIYPGYRAGGSNLVQAVNHT